MEHSPSDIADDVSVEMSKMAVTLSRLATGKDRFAYENGDAYIYELIRTKVPELQRDSYFERWEQLKETARYPGA